MIKYLIDKGNGVSCKNKLQKEIYDITECYRRVVINEEEFMRTFQLICMQVEELNAKHPRCKAEKVEYYNYSTRFFQDACITIGRESFVRLTFLSFDEI